MYNFVFLSIKNFASQIRAGIRENCVIEQEIAKPCTLRGTKQAWKHSTCTCTNNSKRASPKHLTSQLFYNFFRHCLAWRSSAKNTHFKEFESRCTYRFEYFFARDFSGWKESKSLILSQRRKYSNCESSAFVERGFGFGFGRHDRGTLKTDGGSDGFEYPPGVRRNEVSAGQCLSHTKMFALCISMSLRGGRAFSHSCLSVCECGRRNTRHLFAAL